MPSRPEAIASSAASIPDFRIRLVVDRHDFHFLAFDAALRVQPVRREFGALQHALAEHPLFARDRRLEPEPERIGGGRAGGIGAGAPTPGDEQGEGEQAEGDGQPAGGHQAATVPSSPSLR